MAPSRHHHPKTAERPSCRLQMRAGAVPRGTADGTWWPRTLDLAEQLHVLLVELWERLGGVERVEYNPLTWPSTVGRIAVRGRLVQLVERGSLAPDRIDMLGATTRRVTTLRVVPVDAGLQVAADALDRAPLGAGHGVSSRFVGAGRDSTSPSWQDGGELARNRALQDVHDTAERSNAVRTVAGHALDARDCEMLLSMLGLDPGEGSRTR